MRTLRHRVNIRRIDQTSAKLQTKVQAIPTPTSIPVLQKRRPNLSDSLHLILQRCSLDHYEPHTTAPPIVHEVLSSPGRPLDPGTRAFFEPRFGHDFSKVRVYTDAQVAEVGKDVVFGDKEYAPDTTLPSSFHKRDSRFFLVECMPFLCSITPEGNIVFSTCFQGMNGENLRDHSFQWIWENSRL